MPLNLYNKTEAMKKNKYDLQEQKLPLGPHPEIFP